MIAAAIVIATTGFQLADAIAAILIGALIAWEEAGVGNGFPPAFFYNALTVGLGEAVACYVLGIPLLGVMQKHLKLN